MTTRFEFLESQDALEQFYAINRQVEWMSFDTEFVGERRFQTSLCLIQVGTRHGNYLIDPFLVKDLTLLLELIQDPAIVKITHAGENDYRLLYSLYGILPRNVYDTQIAAGFIGYKYPVAFKKLAETELRLHLKKSQTVTDWESRPFKPSQLEYALEDILPLHPLYELQKEKLQQVGRLHWVLEECASFEQEEYYAKDPNHEALNSQLMKTASVREQVFLLRLYAWRNQLAEQRNHSKEMVLAAKYIPVIVKGMRSGKEGLLDNRRLPDRLVQENWNLWNKLFQQPASEQELQLIRSVPPEEEENPREEILIELLYLIIKHHCLEHGVSYALAMPRNMIRRIQEAPEQAGIWFGKGWRTELFGEKFNYWMQAYQRLGIHLFDDRIELRLDHA